MNELIIKVENLTKIYHLYSNPKDRMKEALHPFRKKYHEDFYALKDVSFEVKKGETVGIIGKNGAGKSTLLKILTGVLTPTSGKVQINGRVSSLLELGTGFNPELTGIQNIYFYGTIYGISREDMAKKEKEIIDFADIGEFINQPIKTYSSGMHARLGFAVAMSIDPDILIVDEALSVGDISFQSKCFSKFREFKNRGITILFVTHSVDLILKYCQIGLLLDGGSIFYKGDVKNTVETYRKSIVNFDLKTGDFNSRTNTKCSTPLKEMLKINTSALVYGTMEAEIIDFGIINSNGVVTSTIYHAEEYSIVYTVKFIKNVTDPIFAYTIRSVDGFDLTGTNSLYLEHSFEKISSGSILRVEFKQKMILNSGNYMLCLGCTKTESNYLKIYHRIYDAVIINVISKSMAVGVAFSNTEFTLRNLL